MQEMLQILATNATKHVAINLTFDPIEFQKARANDKPNLFNPEVIISDTLEELSEAPTLDALSNYLFCDNLILNVKEIKYFNFPLHLKLHALLNESYPKLAQKLYTHNESLRTLASEIVSLRHQGLTSKNCMRRITPKEAIQELREGLRKAEGAGFAGPAAVPAVKIFFAYFNTLPPATQTKLLDLGLADIKRAIEHGSCVHEIGGYCDSLKQRIPDNLELTITSKNALENLKECIKKYRRKNREETVA